MEQFEKFVVTELSSTASPPLESSSSSSDDENENTERRKRTRITNYLETIVAYSEFEFKEHFRLNRTTATKICDLYRPHIKPFRGGWNQVSTEKAIYMTIWYLANMETFRQIADRFDTTLSCAHNVISTVTQFLVSQSTNFINWPLENEALVEAENFKKKQGLTYVIGAIDGCHIRIRQPTAHKEDFVNRKGYHSMILQGIVNSKMLFIDIFAGDAGSVHDARVLRKSSIYQKANEDYDNLFYQNYYLLGDSAYPSLRWLKPPYKDNGHLTDEQRQYNFKHSSTRMVIEHAFGLLKGRFRRLRCFDNLKATLIVNCIVASCVLHNMCLMENDNIEEIFYEDV